MRVESGQIRSDLVVAEALTLRGQVTGDISVVAGGMLSLQGMCVGNLTVFTGGRALISGTVCGDVVDRGGTAELTGLVLGRCEFPKD